MLNLRSAQLAFLIVTLVSVAAALFRVATAPDRVRDRRNLAHAVCDSIGGEWTVVDKAETCRRADALPLTVYAPWVGVHFRIEHVENPDSSIRGASGLDLGQHGVDRRFFVESLLG